MKVNGTAHPALVRHVLEIKSCLGYVIVAQERAQVVVSILSAIGLANRIVIQLHQADNFVFGHGLNDVVGKLEPSRSQYC